MTYASRVDREAAIIRRTDPVIYPREKGREGSEAAAVLAPAQLAQYERDGFLFVEEVFSPRETRLLLDEVERLASDPAIVGREEAIREPGSDAVRSVFMVHRLSAMLGRLAADRRIAGAAAQILGSDVYIHQSRANLKPGFFGKEFYWHSDFETWHVEDGMPAMRALSCTVLLTPNDETNGPLMLIPGSHRRFVSCVGATPEDHYKASLRKQEVGVPDPDSLRFLAEQEGIRSMTGPAGSVVFFDCNTMHGSNSNISPYDRSNVFLVYNSVKNRLIAPKHGLAPRPEFIAARESVAPVAPSGQDYLRLVPGGSVAG